MKTWKADIPLTSVLKISLVFALLMPTASFLKQFASTTSLADASYD